MKFSDRIVRGACALVLAAGLCPVPVALAQDAVDSAASEGVGTSEPLQNSWRYVDGRLDLQLAGLCGTGDALLASSGPYWSTANGTAGYSYTSDSGEVVNVSVPNVKAVGIDVSEFQGTIDWAQVKAAGISYAIIRCGFGDNTDRDDYQWVTNIQGAIAAGVPVGVYLYSYADSTTQADSEADHVLRALNTAGVSPSDLSLPIYYDLEESSLESTDNRSLFGAMATTFCDKLQAAGYSVGIYANVNWWTNYLTDAAFDNSSWHRWVAGYYYGRSEVSSLVSGTEIWQFCSQGTVPGISGNVDMDFSYIEIGKGGGDEPVTPISLTATCTSADKGEKATVTTELTGADSATYRFYYSADGGATWKQAARNATGTTTVTATATNAKRLWKVVATTSDGRTAEASFEVAINDPVAVTSTTPAAKYGAKATVSVSASHYGAYGPAKCKYYYSADEGATWKQVAYNRPAADTDSLQVTANATNAKRLWKVIVTFKDGRTAEAPFTVSCGK